MKTCIEHSLPIDEQSALYKASEACYRLHKDNHTFRDIFRSFSWVANLVSDPKRFRMAFGGSEAIKQQCLRQQGFVSGECVFINGKYEDSLSRLPDSVMAVPLSEARTMFAHLLQVYNVESHPLAFLNESGSQKLGVVLYIPENVRLEEPLYIHHISCSVAGEQYIYSPKVILILGAGACAHVCVEHLGCEDDSCAIINGVTEVFVSEEAELLISVSPRTAKNELLSWSHIARVEEKGRCVLVQTVGNQFQGRGWFENEFLLLGSDARAEAFTSVCSPQQSWVRNKMIHDAEGTSSQQVIKSILYSGCFAFEGSIFITPQGQLSQAYQKHDTLLLSDEGQVTTFPRLEILADDVKASHGASVGSIDPRQIFYLRSRGISYAEAVNQLVRGFLTISLADDVFCKLSPTQKVFGEHL